MVDLDTGLVAAKDSTDGERDVQKQPMKNLFCLSKFIKIVRYQFAHVYGWMWTIYITQRINIQQGMGAGKLHDLHNPFGSVDYIPPLTADVLSRMVLLVTFLRVTATIAMTRMIEKIILI